MSNTLINKVVRQLRTMPDDLQQEVLVYTRQLKKERRLGVPGKDLVQFAGSFTADDLEIMRHAVDVDSEQVDLSEW